MNNKEIEIKLDLRQDIDNMVKLRLHRYNVKNCKYPEFYKKLGYIVWGEFKDCPPGTIHYYLYKKF